MSETIADIVREMCEGFNKSWRDIDREWAHGLADRIEAAYNREMADALDTGAFVAEAHKREPITNCNGLNTKPAENVNSEKVVYNGGKMYEALNELLGLFDSGLVVYSDSCDHSDTAQIQYVLDKADAALSDPLRNCDRLPRLWDAVVSFGTKDQGWHDWPDEDVEPGDVNELINRLSADQIHELIDYLYAEAKGCAE